MTLTKTSKKKKWQTASKGKKLVGVKVLDHNPRGGSPKTYYYELSEDLHKGDILRIVMPTGGNPRCEIVSEPTRVKQPIIKEVIRDKREGKT